MKLKGKHVLITGAAKRIGRAIAEKLLGESAKLTAHYFQSKKEVEELKSESQKIHFLNGDLRDVSKIDSLVDESVKALGPIDILINNASSFYATPIEKCKEKDWDDLNNINLKAPFFLARACARSMRKQGGVIINIVDANIEGSLKDYTPYMVSKAGLLMLTRNLAKEWAPSIRVNAISPGPIIFPENYTEQKKLLSIERTLLKRCGSPEDIVHAALFLIENEYMTGTNLMVDGGRSLSM